MKRHYYTDLILKSAITIVFAAIVLLAIAALCSCRTRKETTDHFREAAEMVQAAKTDSLVVWKERTDSVVIRDSVFTLIKGDTVFIKEYHWRDRTNTADNALYKAKTDTVWRERTLTVYKTKTVTLEVSKPLRWWQTALIWTGAACIVAIALKWSIYISGWIKK